ncbi:MAG TPA: DUF4433 domain-containing protein [Gemmatimonadaceae bacterium]|jgi:hypothetical protein|nr:DUF4433 domain-containing protein [Gemmatimonadaceae bacterium]
MTQPPRQPKIYHITHVENLSAIGADGLISDAQIALLGGPAQTIGMSEIKRRRIEEVAVRCYPGTNVGDYVPFYFCPRSIMLYVIHCANHPELAYRGGQGPIVHLEADLHQVVQWAEAQGQRWAFSLSNAGAYYTEFRSQLEELDQLVWTDIHATDFRPAAVKEHKQAEFLVHRHFPFSLVERIGVRTGAIQSRAVAALADAGHQPPIEVRPEWYF